MKTVFISGMLAAGILLSGCETTVVEHRYHRGGYGYYRGYSEPVYRDRYDDGYYRTRNVERVNVYESNNYRTDVHRETVNRDHLRSRSRGERVTSNPRVQTRTSTSVSTQTTSNPVSGKHSKRDKKRSPDELTH